ncbi:hypothetical protein [Eoetvoesiella caeni]|nr:hypothetical protein [Eoetvoesiella caeni]MCI2811312.1 hypothetical protein [Eoetvoesiella caeni]NYT57189.1 hypothetical protein [Eoetvoesiella caeni]
MKPDQVTLFTARRDAMELYFANENIKYIEQRTGVSQFKLSRMAQRCLQLAPDGRIYGFRALIPHIRIGRYHRKAEVNKKRRHQQGGQAGALGLLLERFPDIEDELVLCIRQDSKLKRISEFKLRPKDLHRVFIQCLKSKGVSESDWPFTTVYLGLRTIQKYMAYVLNENFSKSVMSREGPAAVAHLNVGTGHAPFLTFVEPYDAVEIDAYRIDAHLTVAFLTPEGTETEVLLERLWLIAAVDRASTAIIGFDLVYRSEVNSDNVLKVIRDAVTKKWQPKALSLPLNYPLGGGLPSGVIPEAYGAVWSLLLLDGALAHLARAVHDRARTELGFIITWGSPGHFERRPNVERTFRRIADDLFKRLPSTTGANPYNGRAQDGEVEALRLKIRADDIEQILDVYVAQHNSTPCEGISYLTPLDFIRHFLANQDSGFILRPLPERTKGDTQMFSVTQEVTVRGSIADGRRPYIQLDRVHYTSPVLVELGNLIGEKLLVEIDEDDMRQVKAYLKNGAELGFLTAKGRWSTTKHSRRTRKAINSLMSKRVLAISEFDDPVRVYLAHLSMQQKQRSTSPLPRKQATNATRIAKEASLPLEIRTTSGAQRENSVGINQVAPTTPGRRSLMDKEPPVLRLVRNRK